MNFRNVGSDGKDGRLPAEPPLARESSIYSLTFEEFQNTLGGLGKDFGSMNMDELLKNIWTAEETQAMASATAMCGPEAGAGGGMGLQRQGSLTLPRTLSQKTVDEVWRDLFGEGGSVAQCSGGSNWNPQPRQPTLGEMTLEEFLVKAGVVREDMNQSAPKPIISSTNNNNSSNNTLFYGDLSCPISNSNNGGLALGFATTGSSSAGVMPHSVTNSTTANLQMNVNGVRPSYTPPVQFRNSIDLAKQQGIRGGGVMGIGDPTGNNGLMQSVVGLGNDSVTVAPANSPAKSNGELSSLSPVPYVFNGVLGRRKGNGTVEKVVERRQRRMIKNRESAARSRARKQAYTMELEAEVAKLKEVNEELQKKQEKIMEMQKNEALQMMNQQRGPKRQCLRRTQTGPW